MLSTTLCTHRSFYSFTASDGSDGTTAGRVVSPRSIMVHHGLRNKKTRRAIKQNIYYVKQHHTPHCLLPAKVIYPVNSTKYFSWLTRSTSIFVVGERLDIYQNKKFNHGKLNKTSISLSET